MSGGETLLIVEDDIDLRELIRLAGEKRSYIVLTSGNGLEAKGLIEGGSVPDIVILDINMPGMDGFSFCRWLRDDFPLIPVVFLSARAEEYDKIVALEIGGDDYLTKPFSIRELFARAAVCLRRMRLVRERTGASDLAAESFRLGDVRIDAGRWTCAFRDRDIVLTISEFRILHLLLANPDIVFGRDRLAEAAFPDDRYNLGRSIDVHICRIRQKFARIDPDFDSIETVHQVGYKWKR